MKTNHLNRFQFTVKFGEEETEVSSFCNLLLEKRFLKPEVILLAQNSGQAAFLILNGTDQGAFHFHLLVDFEPTLFQSL